MKGAHKRAKATGSGKGKEGDASHGKGEATLHVNSRQESGRCCCWYVACRKLDLQIFTVVSVTWSFATCLHQVL